MSADNEYPVISGIPQNITQDTDPELPTAVVNWTEPTAGDNSGSVTLTSSHVSGETFPIGLTVVTYTAVDDASNMNKESFAIVIEGTIVLACYSYRLFPGMFLYTETTYYHCSNTLLYNLLQSYQIIFK